MEIPSLVTERLGDEQVTAAVNLGDEDVLCQTRTRTIVYSGEGLISDESIAEYSHDVERLTLSEGRRKTKFGFVYVEGTKDLTVPNNRADRALEHVMEGVLRADDVATSDESVLGVYRFSELTLVVTDRRILKHIGASVWDEDFEEYPFEDVTSLAFEEGSVATQFVIGVDGRPRRVKAPDDQAPMVRRTLEEALFAYHDVESVEALNETLGGDLEEADGRGGTEPADSGTTIESDIEIGAGLEPLVGDDEDEAPASESEVGVEFDVDAGTGGDTEAETGVDAGSAAGGDAGANRTDVPESAGDAHVHTETASDAGNAVEAQTTAAPSADALTEDDLVEVTDQLEKLTTAVQRQNELLKKQHKALRTVLAELQE